MACLERLVFLCEVVGADVSDAESVAADLVGVARTDALEGGTYLALACGLFVGRVKKPVRRQDEVRLVRDHKPFADRDSCGRKLVAFGLESYWIEYDAVADYVGGPFPENA